MALPVGMSTCTITFGKPVDTFGVGAAVSITLEPSMTLIWQATGERVPSFTVSTSADAGSGSFALPHVDQAGVLSEALAAVTGWWYTATIVETIAGQNSKVTVKRLQPLVGQTTIDLDLIPIDGTVSAVGSVPLPPVLSVNGDTGTVVLTASDVGALAAASNLSDVASAPTARTNLGLGTAATSASTDFVSASKIIATGCFVADVTNLLQTHAGTSRSRHTTMTACTNLRVEYMGSYVNNPTPPGGYQNAAQDTDNSAAMNIKASVYFPTTGEIYPLTFGGARSALLAPGGVITSDPLAIDLSAGEAFEVLTYTDSTAWYGNSASYESSGTGGWATGDHTDPSGFVSPPDAVHWLLSPTAIYGRPKSATYPGVVVLGDSISIGYGNRGPYFHLTTYVNSGGYILRGLATAGVAALNLGHAGERGGGFKTRDRSFRRISRISSGLTRAIIEYGINDVLYSPDSIATIEASLIAIWQKCVDRGIKAIQTTITPYASISAPKETIRTSINDWLRDGAPIVSASNPSPIAVGATGLRAAAAGHPLYRVWDIADLAETARNSGIWKSGYTTDGLHPNDAGSEALKVGVIAADLVG